MAPLAVTLPVELSAADRARVDARHSAIAAPRTRGRSTDRHGAGGRNGPHSPATRRCQPIRSPSPPTLPSGLPMAPPRPPCARSAPRSAPATLTRAPMIRPAMMASAAFCRASPAKRRAGAGARPIRSPLTTWQRSWQRPASPGAPGAAWNRKRHAADRGATDRAIVAVLFQGGLRRSEAAALRWGDVQDAADGRGIVVYVRRSKTDQDGTAADVRYLKNGCAAALRQLRDRLTVQRSGLRPDGTAQVLGGINGQSIARRLTAAASAAGIEGRITGHSGRVGLAVELTRRGAPEQATAKAGGWKSSRMVAHYAAAVAAEQGAVATYL